MQCNLLYRARLDRSFDPENEPRSAQEKEQPRKQEEEEEEEITFFFVFGFCVDGVTDRVIARVFRSVLCVCGGKFWPDFGGNSIGSV